MVALEHRFIKMPNGNVYSRAVFGYEFWKRYLQVFDKVVVFARMQNGLQPESGQARADGPNVSFFELPLFRGPWQLLMHYHKVNWLAEIASEKADAYILRAPGTISTLLFRHLLKKKIPYGIEVVADPWDGLSPGSVKTKLRPLLRRKMTWDLARQCRYAGAASYVSEYTLQNRYPPGGWSTNYSSVELPIEAIVNEAVIRERIKRVKEKSKSSEPYRIGFIGSISVLCKAPDVLIDAVAACINAGVNLELEIAGEGQSQGHLAELARFSGIEDKVKFLGPLSAGDGVFKQLDSVDLYVLPSRTEGLPRSIIEAMARGVPCIGTNVGGFRELLETDEMVPPNDSKTLAEKIMSVLSYQKHMEKMSLRNIQIAKKYSSDKLNERRIKFYEKVKEFSLDN